MSSQKGNSIRSRPQKYKNKNSYKNDLHDKSQTMESLNSLEFYGICQRCKDILSWKVKYKKYKPMSQPKLCVKCKQKSVTRSYYVVCDQCVQKFGICGKCTDSHSILDTSSNKDHKQIDAEFEGALMSLHERERRTLLRCAATGRREHEGKCMTAKLHSSTSKFHDCDRDNSDTISPETGLSDSTYNESD